MISFNNILQLEGMNAQDVRLVRHQTGKYQHAPSLYEVWRTEPQSLERYQAFQSRKVFDVGDILASFVVTPHPRRETLFVGLYRVNGVGRAPTGSTDPVNGEDVSGLYEYAISRETRLLEYIGRLTIDWGKGSRAWVQRASTQEKRVVGISDQIEPPFPGFDAFCYDIDRINSLYPSWKEVLRRVKGVYLLVDKETGERYVGSATGDDSLWGRFHAYFDTGHGGNRELRDRGRRPYRVSVLQIGSFDNEIVDLESSWKVKLMTREFGLNAN